MITSNIIDKLMKINEQQARYLMNRYYRPQSVTKQLSSFLSQKRVKTWCSRRSNRTFRNLKEVTKLIERYCDTCYQKYNKDLDKRLQNINFS